MGIRIASVIDCTVVATQPEKISLNEVCIVQRQCKLNYTIIHIVH